ncbi:MAG: DEAD/DEAH box helicase family protein, partial [Halosimplex sp.]
MADDRAAGDGRESVSGASTGEATSDEATTDGSGDGATSDGADAAAAFGGGDPAAVWSDVFGFDEPYESQTDAIETAIDVGQRGGYLAMEGPCGTGKTMAALTAGATLVRTTSKYDRVLVVTPVKQQRIQFVEDLRTMNARLADDPDAPDPLSGVALVGKRDLCPYGREGAFPDDASTHDRCEDLRETTADLVEADRRSGDEPAADAALASDPDDVWWDPSLASDLVREARLDADTYRTFDSALETAGAESPYPRSQPSAPEGMTAGDDDPLYCPFEADWFARN